MTTEIVHDRGRGPEIKGTRITVYNLMSYFLDPAMTEARICNMYDLTPEQVAAARAFVLNNAESVLAEHLRIEQRIADAHDAGDVEKALREKATFLKFKQWLVERDEVVAQEITTDDLNASENHGHTVTAPSFREWLLQQESNSTTRS